MTTAGALSAAALHSALIRDGFAFVHGETMREMLTPFGSLADWPTFADSWNHRIREIDTSAHTVTTYAGGGFPTGVGTPGGYLNAGDTAARFHTPTGIAIDTTGNLYVADACNHRIQIFSRDGELVRCWGQEGSQSGELSYPYDLAFNSRADTHETNFLPR